MNLLSLLGQESELLRLAKQVTALLSCLGDLYAVCCIRAPLTQTGRGGLYDGGVPIALLDTHRSAVHCHSMLSCRIAEH